MEIQVFVEPVAGNGYRAVGGPLSLSAEGPTVEDALQNLQGLYSKRMAGEAFLVTLQVPIPSKNRLLAQAGMYANEPLYGAWRQAMDDYRHQVENDPSYP